MPVIYSPLSDSELDSICLSLVNQNLPYFSAFHEAFVLLYLTGCRVEEIFDISRWERLSGYDMRFLPQKDNYHRNVTLDSRCDNFIDAVINQFKPFGGLSSGQLNSLFYNFSEYSNFRVGSKPVSLYLFRYNFIRRLHSDGLNINQIADKMGYTSTTVVGGYLTAEIQKGFFLDMPNLTLIGSKYWMTEYLDFNDGGDGIILKDSFGTGTPLFYYNYSAVARFLSLFPSLSLPTSADINALVSFADSNGMYGIRSYFIPSYVYWSAVLGSMINYFDMSLYGSGLLLNSVFYNIKSRGYLLLQPVIVNYTTVVEFWPTSSSAPLFHTPLSCYAPVRLVLNV